MNERFLKFLYIYSSKQTAERKIFHFVPRRILLKHSKRSQESVMTNFMAPTRFLMFQSDLTDSALVKIIKQYS